MINSANSTTQNLRFTTQESTQPPISKAEEKAKDLFAPVGRTDAEKFKLLEKLWAANSKNRVPSDLQVLAENANSKPIVFTTSIANGEEKNYPEAKELRIELTKLIIKSTPTLASVAISFAKLAEASDI